MHEPHNKQTNKKEKRKKKETNEGGERDYGRKRAGVYNVGKRASLKLSPWYVCMYAFLRTLCIDIVRRG